MGLHNGVCSETKKYLGDECGDEWGICKNEPEEAYEGHRLSCYQREGTAAPKCYPSSNIMDRNDCGCSGFLNLGVVCSSNDCNGHACVYDTGAGKRVCDYGTGNNWGWEAS